jgi:UMF1 family MFS transporter
LTRALVNIEDFRVTDTEIATNDRREIFGWMLYDWANSAFFTVVIGVLIGPYS